MYALDAVEGDKLKALKSSKCKIAQVDVTIPESIQKFKESLGDQPVDLLLNIAGWSWSWVLVDLERKGANHALGIMPEPADDARETVNLKVMERSFAVNAYGPVLLTQALLPNVLKAPALRKIGVISSRVGSIADNTSVGYYAYRASKCAVNSFFKSFAVELKEHDIAVFTLHPGFTKTNLNSEIWKIPGVVEPEIAASGLWKVVKSKGLEDTGKFWYANPIRESLLHTGASR